MLWVSNKVVHPMRAASQSSLGAGMTATDHDDIERLGVQHRSTFESAEAVKMPPCRATLDFTSGA